MVRVLASGNPLTPQSPPDIFALLLFSRARSALTLFSRGVGCLTCSSLGPTKLKAPFALSCPPGKNLPPGPSRLPPVPAFSGPIACLWSCQSEGLCAFWLVSFLSTLLTEMIWEMGTWPPPIMGTGPGWGPGSLLKALLESCQARGSWRGTELAAFCLWLPPSPLQEAASLCQRSSVSFLLLE